MQVQFTRKSGNAKVGPLPVSTTSADTCPDACPLKKAGCYADAGPLGILWNALNKATAGASYTLSRGGKAQALTWDQFCAQVEALPAGQAWRHNQAGDLPGTSDAIDADKLAQLVEANAGYSDVSRNRRGWTYTHKPLTGEHGARNAAAIKAANDGGFTVNLSADNMREADELATADVGPVVVVLPSDVQGNVKLQTPQGRRVAVCPATYRDDVSCASCLLCTRRDRKVIVGFPAHGASKRKASAVAAA
jgi:hypothetical protein